jgi:hypothetical protein
LEGVVGVAQEGDAVCEISAGKSARRVDKDLIEREANPGASGSESVQFLPEEGGIVERTEKTSRAFTPAWEMSPSTPSTIDPNCTL